MKKEREIERDRNYLSCLWALLSKHCKTEKPKALWMVDLFLVPIFFFSSMNRLNFGSRNQSLIH